MAGYAFTMFSNGKERQLISTIKIAACPSKPGNIPKKDWSALWDTGATGTVISKRIVDDLCFVPVSYRDVTTPNGTYEAAFYYIDLYLPNYIFVPNLLVCEGMLTGFDVLVGMDIINLGDFAVSNYKGKTAFTFRIPSLMAFDFADHSYLSPHVKDKIEPGRNEPCPCGSGKKYKNCCGK